MTRLGLFLRVILTSTGFLSAILGATFLGGSYSNPFHYLRWVNLTIFRTVAKKITIFAPLREPLRSRQKRWRARVQMSQWPENRHLGPGGAESRVWPVTANAMISGASSSLVYCLCMSVRDSTRDRELIVWVYILLVNGWPAPYRALPSSSAGRSRASFRPQ